MQQITPTEYAKRRKITLSAVTKAIREKRKLPGISAIDKFGPFYLLTLEETPAQPAEKQTSIKR